MSDALAPLAEGQVVLLLVGLIGSGKSTFAEALEQHFPQFRRCNQDDLGGDRRKVEALARQSLRQGLSVCIDRTNFDPSQRATWINIAHEFPNTSTWVIVFDTPYEVCAARISERTGHPTITDAAQGLSVLARFRSQFRPPTAYEGYSRILNLRPSDHPSPEYTSTDISDILQRLRDSPSVTIPASSNTGHPFQRSFRGRDANSPSYRGTYRGGESFRTGPRGSASPWSRPAQGAPRNGSHPYASSSDNWRLQHNNSSRRDDHDYNESEARVTEASSQCCTI
ncbi:hypothetical protein A0H81_02671 [Grifola frondosa]|uniref:P-loop containing nucleoside triphosphate hydrolase protein n=1 Tax=Grifola frondosa TaxID=5627 RepID=A0A1C7MNM8_GRIFR|nr:hypothetical protein A0H81_02671 [Grifola frondosa]